MRSLIYFFAVMIATTTLAAQQYTNAQNKQNSKNQNISRDTVVAVENQKFGKILTDSQGMTLYIFTSDENGDSTCYDSCAEAWPPLLISSDSPTLATGVAGTLGTTIRRDGNKQVTYNNMPLYYYVKDQNPGDTTGQNVDGKWFVINPEGTKY